MSGPSIRLGGPGDADRLNAALADLSQVLGDTHRATPADLARAGWGPAPVFRAQLAETGGEVCGVTLYSPVFSTRGGSPGVFVSDLWVDPSWRRRGLARRLLVASMRDAAAVWGAAFLKLTVADANKTAQAFYRRLGFRPAEADCNMFIDAVALTATEETT